MSLTICTISCQKLDKPLHSLLYTKIRDFITNNPRPANEYLSTHNLGILFPVGSKMPELIWVMNTIMFEQVGETWCLVAKLQDHIEDAASPFVFLPAPKNECCNIEVYIGNSCYGRDRPNKCLGHLLQEYQTTDGGYLAMPEHKWVGSIVVLRSRSYDRNDDEEEGLRGSVEDNKVYEDITLAEFRSALQYVGKDALLYESKAENKYFLRNERSWTKGFKISYDGDMKVLDKKQFRDVLVASRHMIHHLIRKKNVSAISAHMNVALCVFKCGFQSLVVEAFNAVTVNGAFENHDASILMLCADPGDADTWEHLTSPSGIEAMSLRFSP
ncbi:uncharacterized protein RCO7_06993 [Rhynchosporium graminicola]|uniref:Uncharacterized protein n=1 Tax=Rhynchosporium graminicola TaxID=2792576 RepID=A0A1E1K0W7_9HELO|nr:uncharacterized protein RCO7_06993 [Rhynchosporium commune]